MINISVWQETVQDLCDALTPVSSIDEVIEAGVGARSVELAGGTIDRTILDAQLQLRLDATTSADEAAELIGLGAAIPPPEVVGGSYIGEVDIFPVVNPFVTFDTPDGGTWLPSGNVIPVAQAPELAAYDQFSAIGLATPVFSEDAQLTPTSQKTLIHNGANAAILCVMALPDTTTTTLPRIWVTLDGGATWANKAITNPSGGIRLLGWRWDGGGFRIFWRAQNAGVYYQYLTLATLATSGPYTLTSISALVSEAQSYYGAGVVWDGTQYVFCGLNSAATHITVHTSADGASFSLGAVRAISGGGLTSSNAPRNVQVYYTDRIVVTAGPDNSQMKGTYSIDSGASFSPSYNVPGFQSVVYQPSFTDLVYESGNAYLVSADSSQRRFGVYSPSLDVVQYVNTVANTHTGTTSSRVCRLGAGEYLFCAKGIYTGNLSRIYIHHTVDYGVTWQMLPLVITGGGNTAHIYAAEISAGVVIIVVGNSIYRITSLTTTHVGIVDSSTIPGGSGITTYHCLRIS